MGLRVQGLGGLGLQRRSFGSWVSELFLAPEVRLKSQIVEAQSEHASWTYKQVGSQGLWAFGAYKVYRVFIGLIGFMGLRVQGLVRVGLTDRHNEVDI